MSSANEGLIAANHAAMQFVDQVFVNISLMEMCRVSLLFF